MNLIDLVILGILVIGFILGYKDGFIRKVIGLIGIVVGAYLAVFFAERFGRMLEGLFGLESYFADIVAGMSIFLCIILIFSILKRVVHPFDKVNNFTNQLIGGFVGVVQILFFTSAVLFLINIFGLPKKSIQESSLLYSSVYELIPKTVEFVSTFTPADEDTVRYIIKDTDSIK